MYKHRAHRCSHCAKTGSLKQKAAVDKNFKGLRGNFTTGLGSRCCLPVDVLFVQSLYYIKKKKMVTIVSYIGFLIAFIVGTLSLYIGLLKIKLI